MRILVFAKACFEFINPLILLLQLLSELCILLFNLFDSLFKLQKT
ncbi:hypothetical protein SAMN04487948_11558 [Halogranum amylolyticum]|uniref:Uncharacterized protein n=1 Tax=Halogranum amylolyticum TaxID=660520 RepID=A0A1H8VBB1_9EURY|nr:hypothetical protein SAMN04487948_11558 [Halogranum amylolyticum]